MRDRRHNGGIGRVRFPGEADSGKHRSGKLTAGVPLARIIKPRLAGAAELVVQNRPRSPAAERFRELAATLDRDGQRIPQTLVVTSAADGAGKSVVAVNLALAFAERGLGDVLLLAADLRRVAPGQWLDPAPKVGLADLLSRRTELAHVLIECSNAPLHVLPAGSHRADPVEAFVSPRFEQLMHELRHHYYRIVIDTPPVLTYTDADLVGRFADGALLVARLGQTRRGPLVQALAAVTTTPVLGTVVNDVEP